MVLQFFWQFYMNYPNSFSKFPFCFNQPELVSVICSSEPYLIRALWWGSQNLDPDHQTTEPTLFAPQTPPRLRARRSVPHSGSPRRLLPKTGHFWEWKGLLFKMMPVLSWANKMVFVPICPTEKLWLFPSAIEANGSAGNYTCKRPELMVRFTSFHFQSPKIKSVMSILLNIHLISLSANIKTQEEVFF